MGILSTLISPQKFIILIPFRNGHPTAIQPLDASAEIPRLFFSIQALQPFSWRREGHFQGVASQNACPPKKCALVTSKYSVYYIRTCILVFNLNVDQSIYQVIQFVTFWSPISRSLKLWRGHVFTIPKRAPAELPGRTIFDGQSGCAQGFPNDTVILLVTCYMILHDSTRCSSI